jgi:hypothetical protein
VCFSVHTWRALLAAAGQDAYYSETEQVCVARSTGRRLEALFHPRSFLGSEAQPIDR